MLAAILLPLALALFAPGQSSATSDRAAKGHRFKPVTMRVQAGYQGQYRDTAWLPVRISLTNHTGQDVSGTAQFAESNQTGNPGPPQPFHGMYQAAVTLPAGSTKNVTLYIPGSDADGEVDITFRGNRNVNASGSAYPNAVGGTDLTIGTLSANPSDVGWLRHLNLPDSVDLLRLDAATLDPVPAVLANFDIIAISNVDTSRLDREQINALSAYVQNGGTLLLIGGPNWQETLRPLPPSLLPGSLQGAQTLSNLDGLSAIAPLPASGKSSAATTVSLLSDVQGTVVARAGHIPLVVQAPHGTGFVEYLAFDPSVDPVASWHGANDFFGRLITQAAPDAIGHTTTNRGPAAPPFMLYGPAGGIATELANIPSAALPSLVLFIILTIAYIILLGPANYFLLRRLRRRELSWVTIPALALLCVGSTFGLAYRLKGSTVLLNTMSYVTLGVDGPQPAKLYVGLFAPVRGDYHLTYDGAALPSTIPQYADFNPPGNASPLGLRFQEGAASDVTFLSMSMWSTRTVALQTSLHLSGNLSEDLHLDARGWIVGTVRNGTNIRLLRPAIMAGQAMVHLPDIPPGGLVRVRIRPTNDAFSQEFMLYKMYGMPRFAPRYMGGYPIASIPFMGNGPGPCCYGPSLPPEKSFDDRIRNAIVSLPEARGIQGLGEVVFVAWSDQSFGTLTVDGTTPQRRDLTLFAAPLHVNLATGRFQIHSGTFGAQLVDANPVPPQSGGCCGPYQDTIDIGSGGSATFRFNLPRPAEGGRVRGPAGSVHFRTLTLWVNAGGADGDGLGSVYDWKAARWVPIDLSTGDAHLSRPDRFVSADGGLLVRLSATDVSGDVRIRNPVQNLQLLGSGVVS